MRTFLLLFLVGCAEGPSDETLLTELRVVSIVAEPAEAAPSEPVALSVTAADPDGLGADVLVWTCSPTGSGCLEDGDPLSTRLALGTLADPSAVVTLAPSPALGAALPDDATVTATVVWALACEPGLCPIVDDARAALASGEETPADLAADLADPSSWLVDLPLRGVSLATRALPVSRRPVGVRNENPVVRVANEDALVIEAGERLDLEVAVSDDADAALVVQAFGYATGGGFGLTAFDLAGGQGSLAWYAPAEEGVVDLYVVVDDHDGGSALWRGRAHVE